MRSSFDIYNLCTPSMLYFIISLFGLVIIAFQNFKDKNKLCIGNMNCNVGDNTIVIIIHALYILLWTFILDLMCKNGWGDLSWFLFLLPFIVLFLFTFYAMIFYKFKN